MITLSLFDGISIAQQALKELNIKYNKYYASEIDKKAIEVTLKNFPNTVQLGDITKISDNIIDIIKEPVDLLIGGSPCQDLSFSNSNRKGLQGERSKLFFEYIKIKNTIKPKYFVLENVASMEKENRDIISKYMGCEPIMINASLVSAQHRKRLFWTNIKNIEQPKDKNIFLKDILLSDKELNYDEKYYLRLVCNSNKYLKIYKNKQLSVFNLKPILLYSYGSQGQGQQVHSIYGKSITLLAGWTGIYQIKDYARKLEPIECERLQSLPDDYTLISNITKNKRIQLLGNGFNCEVIKHILSYINKD